MGLRMIIYIDDIPILSETESLSREQTAGLVFLLENLGFIINYPKSILEPSKKIKFLGFIVDSTTMEIKLPGEKIKKIRMETRKLKDLDNPQATTLSRLLGKLNHATQAIQPAPLFYCNLQSYLQALEEGDQDYSTPV